ncbi:DmsC/YnfH family molybdoenzyme membrane anchor subunit [Thalassotalea castellviae]|uniref:DmsC/YnfH family molybdoenzyme membrane anchor subunit n=1 Tax=Thalassotalea castellviae TaxID=3075612 RepID=A0ABU2ZW73_9GAMM|nr:DmsC/YnfH family molybdoenzyme membrane anchor subunit [Thalassotalea sp. W431]MDT0602185.1 DmsC/YnfH family molybdoenzyme membrane anchor subunit [Thalassotalea sp. W431]
MNNVIDKKIETKDPVDLSVGSFDPATMSVASPEQAGRSNHWEVRTQEQDYAFLPTHEDKSEIKEKNRYGQLIDCVDLSGLPKERSMFINENPEVGTNPNRNKQHGFFFTADNCIGCHACEAACSEKNENPAHLAFRSVGYVEGGSYPDYKRMNISMACNHCDDPVCLKGCPTKAYTKHAEYGAVLQDPETCFGCGYCTWVCPYNAPQLDPVKGQVSKCNMCVDRLEVGLKPACVSACVGNALDFGVIENTPENREQCKTSIPGFPDPEITHPNIRFQQTKTLPDEMNRTDSMPVKYHKDKEGYYKSVIDQKAGKAKHWNFGKLNSRENPLVLFTLFAQAAFGTFLIPFLTALFGVEAFTAFVKSEMFLPLTIVSLLMTAFALLMSVTHLGKPMRFYRGFNNLRYSPMAREGFGLAMFSAGCGLTALFSLPMNEWVNELSVDLFAVNLVELTNGLPLINLQVSAGIFALLAGTGGIYYMNKCYQIKARPFWHHIQTATSFLGNSLSLGALVSGVIVLATLIISDSSAELTNQALLVFTSVFTLGLLLEGIGLIKHNKDLNSSDNEGGAAHYIQCTTFGKTYVFRNTLLALNTLAAVGLLTANILGFNDINSLLVLWSVLALVNCATAVIGRALFYILVIPTTMPGAFFWKNKGFEQHARDIGLADNPATGVAPLAH